MKLKPYAEILAMAEEEVNETLTPARTKRARMQAELEMAKIEESIATKEAEIYELCANTDIDFDDVIEAQDSLALSERKKKQFEQIIKEMFPK